MRTLSAFFLLFALAACKSNPPVSYPPVIPCSTETHYWGNDNGVYHLDHDKLTPYIVNQSAAYEFNIDDWNALNTQVEFVSANGSFPIAYEDVHLPEGKYLGLASVTLDSNNHIIRASVKMNVALLSKYPDNVWRHVSCQEGGHLLGLGHDRDDLSSCMNDCASADSSAKWLECLGSDKGVSPSTHDGEMLREIYKHVKPATEPGDPSESCTRTLILHEFGIYGSISHEH